jgi:hypothetical protein
MICTRQRIHTSGFANSLAKADALQAYQGGLAQDDCHLAVEHTHDDQDDGDGQEKQGYVRIAAK